MFNKFNYDEYEDNKENINNNLKEKEKKSNFNDFNKSSNNSKNMLKSLILIFIILGIVGTYAVIKFTLNKENNNDNTNLNIKEDVNENESLEASDIKIIDINSKTRPYAVMINCHNGALPQAGLQDAYIVYEIMVEGGITRMMALFKDKDISKIGSIRSARTQYLDYVYENDAIYAHAGGARDALNRIANEGISDIDVDGEYGFRDTSLNRSWEHTLFTSTNLLLNGVNAKGLRQTTDTPNLLTYTTSLDLSTYNTQNATNISIKYSDYRTSNYTYDATKKVYLRSMNNTKNIDLVTNLQYEVKNIIVYSVRYSNYTYNGYSAYQKIDNVGTGDGYYITEGKAIPITWEKTSNNSQTKYIVKETGKELVVNDGNTYIQIYPTSGNLTIN